MLGRHTKQMLSVIALGGILVQSFFFVGPRKAEAIDFKTATQGVISAGVGCAASNLIQRKLSGKLSGLIDSEVSSEVTGLGSVSTSNSKTDENTKALADKENCLKKIARAASQVVLKEITRQTVNWINTGFNGQPLFVRNPASFFKSLADREVQSLANTFKNRNSYPYGEAFIRGYVRTVQNTLERNAQYNFTHTGGYTRQQFATNFNNGGWEAWKVASLPQNNPIGFSLMASDELAQRLAGTKQSAAQDVRDELQQGLGFLSPKICVDPLGYIPPSNASISITEVQNQFQNDPMGLLNQIGVTPEQAAASIGVSVEDLDTLSQEEVSSLIAAAQSAGYGQYVDQCRRYETSTPGGVVSSQLTAALNIPKDNLLLAPEDLDASLQTVFDALLNQLFKKGLASLTDLANGSNDSTGAGNVQVYSGGGYGSNTSVAQTSSQSNTNDQWFNQNPQFDITDVASIQEIIDTQNDYIKAIVDDPAIPAPTLNPAGMYPLPAVLSASTKGQNFWLSKIIPEIYQLDYCIPGPHPGWENEAAQNLAIFKTQIRDVSSIIDAGERGKATKAIAQLYDSITLGIPHQIANIFTNLFTSLDLNADDVARIYYYNAVIAKATGIVAEHNVNQLDKTQLIQTRDRVNQVLDTLFERFIGAMNQRFNPTILPSSAGEAAVFYSKIPGYNSIFVKNSQDSISLGGIVRRLGEIKDQITAINAEQSTLDAQVAAGTVNQAQAQITQADLDNRLDFAKRSFGNLAQNFVTQDDIQGIQDQTSQLISDIVYIHNTLLKGPSGCETQIQYVPQYSRVRAWPYTKPHYYDYPRDSSGNGIVNIVSLNIDPLLNNVLGGGSLTPDYYPFMEYGYFADADGINFSTYAGWTPIMIDPLLKFDVGDVANTVGLFEARLLFGEIGVPSAGTQ